MIFAARWYASVLLDKVLAIALLMAALRVVHPAMALQRF